MIILLVEDEDPKREKVLAAIRDILDEVEIIEARSVNSAIKCIKSAKLDLILLDMSLPTYDVSAQESGGQPRGFGGIEVLRYLDRLDMEVPVIVVTAYDAFAKDGGQIDLDGMRVQLASNHPLTYKGAVYFNSVYETWREELAKLMRDVLG